MPAQKRSYSRAGRMNPAGSCHVGATSECSLSGTATAFGHTIRNTTNTPKQTHAQTRVTSSIHQPDDHQTEGSNDINPRYAHPEASNIHSSSSSNPIRLLTGKDSDRVNSTSNRVGPVITSHPDMMGKNLQPRQARTKTRFEPNNIGSCPQPSLLSPGQSNTGTAPSRDVLQVDPHVGDTTKKRIRNGDKKTLRRNMDRVPGFDGGTSTVSARSIRRQVQGETGAVPVPVPVNGTRPNPASSTSAAIMIGKRKENGQAKQVSRSSSLVIIEREGVDNINGSNRPIFYWKPQPAKKREKKRRVVRDIETTNNFNVDTSALDADRQRKAAALKNMSFSKRVKEEVREEGDALRVTMGGAGAGADGLGDGRRSGESRKATVGEMLEQVPSPPPRREHSPWTWDGQGNIPGLRAMSRSARIHRPYDLPQAAGVVNVETRAIPIPMPSLFPDPSDSAMDISDEDLYSPKQVEKVGVQVHMKEEQREDEDGLFDSPVPSSFLDLQTPISASITIDLEQNTTNDLAMLAMDNSASYPLDTECTIHPKNKRKQHNLKNVRSPKKAKTDVCASNVGEDPSESNREVVRVQDEDGGRGDVPCPSMPAPKKREGPPRKGKGKKKKYEVIDQVETDVIVPLASGEDEMEICAVETKQGEITIADALSLAASEAVSTAGPSDSQTGNRETVGESESTGAGGIPESAKQEERIRAETGISLTPLTNPLPASASVHDATRAEPSAPGSIMRRSGRKEKKKGRATENGRKRKVIDQTTEVGEQTQHHDVNLVGGEEISHPDVAPRKRKVNDQSIDCQDPKAGASPAEDGEEPHPDKTPRKRTKMNDRTTEGGERTQGPADIPHQEESLEKGRNEQDLTAEGGHDIQGPSVGSESVTAADMARSEEALKKQTTRDDQNTQGSSADSAAANDIARPDETPKGKVTDQMTAGRENIQDSSADLVVVDEIARPGKKGKKTDPSPVEGAPEAEKTVVRRGRPPKGKKDDKDTNGETSSVKVTAENELVKEVKGKTPRGRKKRETMDEKGGMADSVVIKKKRVKLTLEEGGDGDQQSGEHVKSTVKWMLVRKNRTSTGRKASRQGKGKEKAQFTATAPDMDLDENAFKEETEGNGKTLKPSIWTSSKAELLLVLPELSGSKCFNGITEGSSNFPMVMLDESTAEGICVDVRWFDGEESESAGETPSVRLTLVRDFICPASTAGIPTESVPSTAPPDPMPSSQSNVPSHIAPSTSFVQNAYGNDCRIDGPPLPAILPHYDNDGMRLEYVDEDAPQEGVATLSARPPQMSSVFLTQTVPYAPPVAQEAMATAHISHQMQHFAQAHALPTYHPGIQFGQHTLSTPSTFSFPSRQTQYLLPFQYYQIPFPQYTGPPVPIPIPTLPLPVHDEKPSPPTPSELKSELDTFIPPSPPPEVEILTSSWKRSLPLILISSHETFKRHFWGSLKPPPHSNGPGDSPEQTDKVSLAAEQAYVFLGFFRVVKMDQRRITLPDEERADLRPGKVAGRVEWTFDVEWVPGYHGSKGSEELSRPWWAPDLVFGRPMRKERGSRKGFTWSEKHAQARLNLLPMQLVDGQEAGSSDEAMPKGWLCKACGKLNQKVMMRHRWCGSRICRDNPLSRGYAVDLSSARDANQTPLALPINTYNRTIVDASVVDWDDGMRTLKYRPISIPNQLGNAGERGGILQHVFTCNLVDLQTEATLLYESIQSKVCLMKSTGDSGPLFKSHVSNSYANKRDKYAFSCLSWSEAPQAAKDAKDLMIFMGKYGEEETLDIDHLTIIGWVSSGSRKTPMILAAREHTIAMLCLGNDVVLTIVPRWEVLAPVPWSIQVQQPSNLSYPPFAPDAETVNPAALPPSMPVLPHVTNFTPPKIQSTLGRTPRPIKPPSANQMQLVDVAAPPATENRVQQVGTISENFPGSVVPAQITSGNSRSKPASKLKPKSTQAPESMSVTLVHGDMLLFSGCDFEYSIKRMGTSILVIGSKEDSTASI